MGLLLLATEIFPIISLLTWTSWRGRDGTRRGNRSAQQQRGRGAETPRYVTTMNSNHRENRSVEEPNDTVS